MIAVDRIVAELVMLAFGKGAVCTCSRADREGSALEEKGSRKKKSVDWTKECEAVSRRLGQQQKHEWKWVKAKQSREAFPCRPCQCFKRLKCLDPQ